MKLQLLIVAIAASCYCADGFTVSKPHSHLHLHSHGRLTFTRSQHQRSGGTLPSSLAAYPPRKNKRGNKGDNQSDDGDDYDPIVDEPRGKRGDGRNWIEKTSPMGIGKLKETKDSETDGNYDLGIDGSSFDTGSLSARMYDAIMSVAMKRFPPGTKSLPSELEDVYRTYAMDSTAKEAVKAALDQNGMDLALMNDDDPQSLDEGMWGVVESVRLVDPETGKLGSEAYECLDDAVEKGDWVPGQSFNFVVRNVPAKLKEMDISDLLTALDPEGAYRDEAKDKGITMPDEDIASLKELGLDCDRRTKISPAETQSKENVFKGDDTMGYNIIKRSDLLQDSRNADGTENNDMMMHVMDSLVSHGCLVVDLSDGGASSRDSRTLANMWEVASSFFDTIESDAEALAKVEGMAVAEGAGSSNAVVGFSSYNNATMQFLETRSIRNEDGANYDIVPAAASQIIGKDGVQTLLDAFNFMCDVGKDIVRVSVAAANMEHDGFLEKSQELIEQEGSSDLPLISGLTFDEAEVSGGDISNDEEIFVTAERLSSEAASIMVEDLIDDGQHIESNENAGIVNMSPHRLCKYTEHGDATDNKRKETFGAHTDTSFMTIVPVASTSGLEIFDEGANRWFRPELLARKKWEIEREARGLDPSAQTETITVTEDGKDKEVEMPWHCRYICMMPGELLQICTRNEISCAVHRVVSASSETRISVPVLLRVRSGMTMDIEKYFGTRDNVGPLLHQCDGMKMQEIYDAVQPSSYRS